MGRVENANIRKPKNKISQLPDKQQISRERPTIVQHTSLILEKPIIASSTKKTGYCNQTVVTIWLGKENEAVGVNLPILYLSPCS